jgi:hypothetical protein
VSVRGVVRGVVSCVVCVVCVTHLEHRLGLGHLLGRANRLQSLHDLERRLRPLLCLLLLGLWRGCRLALALALGLARVARTARAACVAACAACVAACAKRLSILILDVVVLVLLLVLFRRRGLLLPWLCCPRAELNSREADAHQRPAETRAADLTGARALDGLFEAGHLGVQRGPLCAALHRGIGLRLGIGLQPTDVGLRAGEKQ